MDIITSFFNTQIQLLNTLTEETLFGWIVPTSLEYLIVNLETAIECPSGTTFTALISNPTGSGNFPTTYRGIVDGRSAFDQPLAMRLVHDAHTSFQKLAYGHGVIGSKNVELKLLSIGRKEIYIETIFEPSDDKEVQVTLNTADGQFNFFAKTAEIVRDPENAICKVLLKITNINRIDEGRWAKLHSA